eukprot:128490_1
MMQLLFVLTLCVTIVMSHTPSRYPPTGWTMKNVQLQASPSNETFLISMRHFHGLTRSYTDSCSTINIDGSIVAFPYICYKPDAILGCACDNDVDIQPADESKFTIRSINQSIKIVTHPPSENQWTISFDEIPNYSGLSKIWIILDDSNIIHKFPTIEDIKNNWISTNVCHGMLKHILKDNYLDEFDRQHLKIINKSYVEVYINQRYTYTPILPFSIRDTVFFYISPWLSSKCDDELIAIRFGEDQKYKIYNVIKKGKDPNGIVSYMDLDPHINVYSNRNLIITELSYARPRKW